MTSGGPISAARSPAQNAELALLLEVAGTPKPGNVDRRRDLAELRFEHFLAGAVGSAPGLRAAADGAPVGDAFERAVAGMANQRGGNTQFGCLLLLVPLVRAASSDELTPDGVRAVVSSTTVDDAAAFYRAFERVDVAVGDPPEDADALDVRRGGEAIPALRERGLTLYDIMDLSAPRDGNAREWTDGFRRSFAAAARICGDEGPILDRTARAFLSLLAEEPDTLVATKHGEAVARIVSERAAAVDGDLDAAEALADEFVRNGYNPGTTADLTAAALFIALERGVPI
ncbi:triphosphoribosyl-dephospho-CoA synthase [Haloferacaceae archaeon DSL9]